MYDCDAKRQTWVGVEIHWVQKKTRSREQKPRRRRSPQDPPLPTLHRLDRLRCFCSNALRAATSCRPRASRFPLMTTTLPPTTSFCRVDGRSMRRGDRHPGGVRLGLAGSGSGRARLPLGKPFLRTHLCPRSNGGACFWRSERPE